MYCLLAFTLDKRDDLSDFSQTNLVAVADK